MSINLGDIAKKAIMNAPGSAGRIIRNIREFESIANQLRPNIIFGSRNDLHWKYKLSSPVCYDKCIVEFYHSAAQNKNIYGGNIYALLSERVQIVIENHYPTVCSLPWHKGDDDFIAIDDCDSLTDNVQQIQKDLMACRMAERHMKTDEKHYSVVLQFSDIDTDHDVSSTSLHELVALRYNLLKNGLIFLRKLDSDKACNVVAKLLDGKHGIEDINRWKAVKEKLGSYRLLKGFIQQFSLYRLESSVNQCVSFLAKFNNDIFIIDMNKNYDNDTKLFNIISIIANNLITDKELSPSTNEQLATANEALNMYEKVIEDQLYNVDIERAWLDGLDDLN